MSCEHKRTASVSGKTSDLCVVRHDEHEVDGGVPRNMGIGGGDYISFSYCLDCGKILSNQFPVSEETIKEVFDLEE